MFRIRLTYLFFIAALLISTVLPASAQTPSTSSGQAQQPQLYIPQVGISDSAIGEGPLIVNEETSFEPEPEVESANTGSANFFCAYGQTAGHRWYVTGPGYMYATWSFVDVIGILRTVRRSYYASGKGYIYVAVTPGSFNKVTKVDWNYTGLAVNSGSSCIFP